MNHSDSYENIIQAKPYSFIEYSNKMVSFEESAIYKKYLLQRTNIKAL